MQAVDGVSFSVERGETLGIVGESGCGKSVANMTILGLTRAANARISGRIAFEGRDLLGLGDEELRRVRGNEIAMVFQDPLSLAASLLSDRRPDRRGDPGPPGHPEAGRARGARRAARRWSGSPTPERRVDDYPHEFSGGMRQRAMIAMALANEPKLLIADEPTTALDVTTQAQILRCSSSSRSSIGMAVILITHDLGVVAEIADEISVMYAGRIVERAPVETSSTTPSTPTPGACSARSRASTGQRRAAVARSRAAAVACSRPRRDAHFRPRCPHAFERATERSSRRSSRVAGEPRARGSLLARRPSRSARCG